MGGLSSPSDLLLHTSGKYDNCTNSSCGSGQGIDNELDYGIETVDNSSITCSEDFFLVEGPNITACHPECPYWRQYRPSISTLVDVLVLMWGCVGILCACGVLIISCIRYKHIFVFPSIFVVYLTTMLLVLLSFILVNFFDRKNLFCKSRSLLQSALDPTPFCIISGIVFYYCIIQITLWWFFHVSALFWTFKFPLHFRRYHKLKRIRYMHITFVALGLVLPVLPILVTMVDYATDVQESSVPIAKGLGFGITNFPPILCAGIDADATFYSLILPATIISEVTMTMLVITFWDIRKMRIYKFHSTKKKKSSHIGTGEKKILIVLLYYAFLFEFALMAFTLATRNVDIYRHAVKVNFACESRGYNPDYPCDRTELESLKYPGVSLVAYMFLELFPVVNFIYVINVRKCKRWILKHVIRIKEERSDITTSESKTFSILLHRTSMSKMTNYSIDIPEIVQEIEPPANPVSKR